MKNVYAFIVGIEKYDQPAWDVPGPCANALAIAEWCIDTNVPPENIFLFLDPLEVPCEETLKTRETIAKIKVTGANVTETANLDTIDTFWRVRLSKDRTAKSRLLVYWSGHGFTDTDGTRVLICRDYTDPKLKNRVFNASNFIRHLRGEEFQCFQKQIFLADVCANYTTLNFAADQSLPGRAVASVEQMTYFATPEGKYAKGDNGRGVFTNTAMKVLRNFNDWPELKAFSDSMDNAFEEVGDTPFRIEIFGDPIHTAIERRVGRVETASDDEVLVSAIKGVTQRFVAVRFEKSDLSCLIGDPLPANSASSRPSFSSPQPNRATQRGVFEELLAEFSTPSGKHFTITGHAGVGKSTVLMALASELSTRDGEKKAPLPVLITFNAIHTTKSTLDSLTGRDPQRQILGLFGEWATWVTRNGAPPVVTAQWLLEYAERNPVVVLLDGLDDLLARNARLSLADIVSAVAAMRQIAPGNVGTAVTLRKSHPGIRIFAQAAHFLEIDRIADSVACQICPRIRQVLDFFDCNDAKEVILTPLLFFWIAPRVDSIIEGLKKTDPITIATTNRAQLMERVLLMVLESSAVVRTSHYFAPQWLDALTIIAWAFHSPEAADNGLAAHSTMNLSQVQQLCSEFTTAWHGDSGTELSSEHRNLLGGFALATQGDTLRTILEQTIFFPSYGQSFQFIHRDWHDLLVGRYFRICLDYANVREWGRLAHSLTISGISAELMGKFKCPSSLSMQVVKEYREVTPRNVFMVGNFFGAVAANPLATFEPNALEPLLAAVEEYDTFTRTLLITGVGNRILLTENWHEQKALFLRTLRTLRESTKLDPVSRSAVYCFHAIFSESTDAGTWPDVTKEDSSRLHANLCTPSAVDVTVTPRQRSLQIPIAELLRSVHLSNQRSISTVHFLTMLSAVASYGALTAEAVGFVAEAVAPGSCLETAVRNTFPGLRPILTKMLCHCRYLWSLSPHE